MVIFHSFLYVYQRVMFINLVGIAIKNTSNHGVGRVWMPVFEVLHSRNLSYPKMDVHVPPSNSWATMDLFPNMASP
jgi:hypothetical protein